MKADIEEYQYKCHESYTHRFLEFLNGFQSTDVKRQTNYLQSLSGGRVLELDKKKPKGDRGLLREWLFFMVALYNYS